MADKKVSITRIDLNAIHIKGDTLHFDTDDGPKELQHQTAEGMAETLNRFADQFVPIYDADGRQINPYYGDKSIGMDRPGNAFRVDRKKR